MSDHQELQGKVIVITGASSGFGRGTAVAFAKAGARVVLAARSGDVLDALAAECEAAGGEALAVATDVGAPADVDRLTDRALQRFGHIDVWINNAGVAAIGRFDRVPLEDHERVIRTDLMGTVYGSYAAMKHFRLRNAGTLINVASVIGKIPAPFYASYAAAKFGVVGFSDSLRQELGQDKIDTIHVCTVMPMAHDTSFFEHASNYTGHEAAELPPTYDPQVTIRKLVQLATAPEDEVITGAQGKLFNVFHKLMPGAVEKYMSENTEASQFENSPPAAPTRGSVHRPSSSVS